MTAQRIRILAGARVRPSPALAALVVVVLASAASTAELQQLDPAAYPRIVNGLTTHAYAAVGALLRGDLTAPTEHLPITADTATPYCSGTLIGCRTFLTAAHCLDTPGQGTMKPITGYATAALRAVAILVSAAPVAAVR